MKAFRCLNCGSVVPEKEVYQNMRQVIETRFQSIEVEEPKPKIIEQPRENTFRPQIKEKPQAKPAEYVDDEEEDEDDMDLKI